MSSDDQSAESFHGEDDFNKKKLESLKNLRENINWKVRKERNELLFQLYPLISDWTIGHSDLRSIFRPKEINWLLIEEVKNLNEFFNYITERQLITRNYDETRYQWKLLDFVNKTGYKDVPEVNRDGKPLLRRTTPLHHVSRFNNWTKLRHILRDRRIIPIIRKLFNIYNRFDLNYADDLGCTHFHVACEYGLKDVVQKFLELGQDPNLLVQKTGNSPLYLALSHNKREVSRLLLKHGADPNVANKDGRTALHVLGENYWNSPNMEMIFELKKKCKPGQVDARDKSGNTPLHLAVPSLFTHVKHVVQALLEIGANPNVANNEGLTPMHIICKRHCNDGLWELFWNISDDMKRPVQLDVRDKSGNTPLHYALKYKDHNVIKLLLRNGADPNAVNEEGLTPLHIISKTDYFWNWAKMFTNKEFNPLVQVDARDKLGRTPLQLAVANLLPNMVDVLLDNGADLSSFVFPTEDYFAEKLEPLEIYGRREKTPNFKLRIASRAMAVIECLENRGYEVDRSNALTVMKFFADYELFDKSADLEACDGAKLMKKVKKTKKIKILPKKQSSLYDLIRLRPEELAKSITLKDLKLFAGYSKLCKLPKKLSEACVLHLCEMISRMFFRSWATISFLDLTRCKFPVLCCEKIIENLKNEDYYRRVGSADKKVKRKSDKESLGIYLYKDLKQVHAYSNKSTITSREIQMAVGPLLLGELVKHVISEGTKFVTVC
ncbi:uncharacterized protein LOC111694373 [Trichogramma pretiosum]|uniref:uncharacterized protein LOC111694373 n=1 Tax=Trichogramma pretiosum TaxID=7493 RepID=UPI000C71C3BD|nr:uncharacterized protein LOC111694373 [Trichogramma pretiosum]